MKERRDVPRVEELLPARTHRSIEDAHGRVGKQEYRFSRAVSWLTAGQKWPGLQSIGLMRATREVESVEPVHEQLFIFPLRRHWRGNSTPSPRRGSAPGPRTSGRSWSG